MIFLNIKLKFIGPTYLLTNLHCNILYTFLGGGGDKHFFWRGITTFFFGGGEGINSFSPSPSHSESMCLIGQFLFLSV